ncbi:TM2 domain-containing protein [Mucilaginibacter robiniae]|uniref:TM2 domain-containing protein n=1 Tax=Mucilaginibacter robiniae TaxID=2728022 RepID=A0A7L5E7Q5_9SPHI|nr:TM2 domain-containing protein [Mucilaginibacter robiniae]QJD96386.1 TM2 domain-containing protein [Mucilaginibacter robiniae]
MDFNYYTAFSGITPEEVNFLQQATAGLTETQHRNFLAIYGSKRRSPQDILLFTLLGFVVVAGVQRFVVGQIVMGIIYLLTGGFCLVGTIVDLINHKSLANNYNRDMAYESLQIAKMTP